MGPGEHVGEAGRGFDETRFAYINNCVKGFERLNVLSTYVSEILHDKN